MRAALAGLIVLATVGFAIGASIERHRTSHESAAQLRAEGAAEGGHGESAAHQAAENAGTVETETHRELRPLGLNIEAVPFIVLAALASLALAALGWARPRWLLGLTAIAGAMIVFGALDVREAFHQSDENQTGLVILAAMIAALHVAAAGTAAALAARRIAPGAAGAAGTISG